MKRCLLYTSTDDDCPNREESINDKAAHVYDDDADTTCDVCGYERTVTPPSHEHSYGDWSRDCLLYTSPEKTQGGELISAYECDPKTADAEFQMCIRDRPYRDTP